MIGTGLACRRCMHHHVARATRHTLIFRTWNEAAALWEALGARVPGVVALCLMPDHLHLLTQRPRRRELGRALQAYSQWRNRRRGESGPCFEPAPPPDSVEGVLKERRNVRYIHLNPCRKGLASDPLEWPFSTHRDAVGLALSPVVRGRADPAGFHAYVSGDPSVDVQGSELPLVGADWGAAEPRVGDVLAAVSALSRRPLAEVRARGRLRTLAIGVCRTLTSAGSAAIAAELGVHRTSVGRVLLGAWRRESQVVQRVLADGRFPPLLDHDLRQDRRWGAYRSRR